MTLETEKKIHRIGNRVCISIGCYLMGTLMIVAVMKISGCGPEPEQPTEMETWEVETVNDSKLPSVEEQEIMDKRIAFCRSRFTWAESTRACYMGYLAQPINATTEL